MSQDPIEAALLQRSERGTYVGPDEVWARSTSSPRSARPRSFHRLGILAAACVVLLLVVVSVRSSERSTELATTAPPDENAQMWQVSGSLDATVGLRVARRDTATERGRLLVLRSAEGGVAAVAHGRTILDILPRMSRNDGEAGVTRTPPTEATNEFTLFEVEHNGRPVVLATRGFTESEQAEFVEEVGETGTLAGDGYHVLLDGLDPFPSPDQYMAWRQLDQGNGPAITITTLDAWSQPEEVVWLFNEPIVETYADYVVVEGGGDSLVVGRDGPDAVITASDGFPLHQIRHRLALGSTPGSGAVNFGTVTTTTAP